MCSKDGLSSLIYYQENNLNVGSLSWNNPLQNQYGSRKKVFVLGKEIKREISNEIPVESWCGTLGAMRRAWRGCLNAGTTGDSISTRRIPICHTVPWQPSYCLNLLNSGSMYCGVPEWKQITLLHMLPGFILLANVAHKTHQQYSHLGILRKVLLHFRSQCKVNQLGFISAHVYQDILWFNVSV